MDKSLEGMTQEELEGMAATYQAIISNPKTRSMALTLTKTVNPELHIPEVDLVAQLRVELAKRDADIAEIKKGRDTEAIDRRIEGHRQELRNAGYKDTQIKEIEDLMQAEGMTYASGRKFYDLQKKVAVPTPPATGRGAHTFSMPSSPLAALKGRRGNHALRDWSRNEASSVIDEIAASRVQHA